MRVIKSLIALFFVAMGVVFGALNKQRVHVDLWFGGLDGRLGLFLLTVLLLGAFIGGVAVLGGVVWPLRRRLHRSSNAASGPDKQELASERESRQ